MSTIASTDLLLHDIPVDVQERAAAIATRGGFTLSDLMRRFLNHFARDDQKPFDPYCFPGTEASDKREQEIVRERAQRAFAALRSQAALNGTADMPLDEINEEIRAARAGEGVAA